MGQPTGCPLSFRTAHEDYYISRLESPWACDEEGSTLETIPINIVNSKYGKMMGLNSDIGASEVSSDNTLWTFRPSCDGGVELTNIGPGDRKVCHQHQEEGSQVDGYPVSCGLAVVKHSLGKIQMGDQKGTSGLNSLINDYYSTSCICVH